MGRTSGPRTAAGGSGGAADPQTNPGHHTSPSSSCEVVCSFTSKATATDNESWVTRVVGITSAVIQKKKNVLHSVGLEEELQPNELYGINPDRRTGASMTRESGLEHIQRGLHVHPLVRSQPMDTQSISCAWLVCL